MSQTPHPYRLTPDGYLVPSPDSSEAYVEQALRAAKSGSAGHWPTVATVLHDEVLRLRAELAETVPATQPVTVDETAFYGALLDRLGFIEDGELWPGGSEQNDLADERAQAVIEFLDLVRESTLPRKLLPAAKDTEIERLRAELRFERDAAKSLARDLRVQWQASEERERVARREVKELRGAGDRAAEMVSLLKDLVDPDDCQFDHHGGCQAHGYLSLELDEQCPVQEAKDLIDSWRPATEPAEAAEPEFLDNAPAHVPGYRNPAAPAAPEGTEPRQWYSGDPEPPGVRQVKDRGDRRWVYSRTDRNWYMRDIVGPVHIWDYLVDLNGPLTEVPTEGGKA